MTDRLLTLPIAGLLGRNAVGNIRRSMDPTALRELADSIKSVGVLEPVGVQRNLKPGDYTLIYGFRRCAAARLAGLRVVPAVVVLDSTKGVSLADVQLRQLTENLHREGLTPLEEARTYKLLTEGAHKTQVEVGKLVGKSQPYIANRLRLLSLPGRAAELVEKGTITPSAAEQLLRIPADGERELKRVVRSIELEVARDGQVDPRMLRYTVNSALTSYTDRKQAERAVRAAAHPSCPVKDCGLKGVYRHYTPDFTCRNGHWWNPKTGRVTLRETHDPNDPRSAPKEPPKPTLPLVEMYVETPDLQVLASRIMDGLRKVYRLEVDGEDHRVRVSIVADAPELVAAGLTPFEKGTSGPAAVSGLESWCQTTDASRRKAAEIRARFVSFLGTVRGRGRPKKEVASGPPPGSAKTVGVTFYRRARTSQRAAKPKKGGAP